MTGGSMNKPTVRKLHRRAETLHRKAEELNARVNAAFGFESYASTMGDNLIIATGDMLETLDRALTTDTTGD
jgi:hypothetical protein